MVRGGGRVHASGQAGVDEGRVVGGEVELVADEEDGELGGGEVPRVVEEGGHGAEGRVRGDVVDEDGAGGAAVVGAGDGAEALGAGGIPQLRGMSVSRFQEKRVSVGR